VGLERARLNVFVEYWSVGTSPSSLLPMSTGDVSRHLLMDWVPSLPVNVSASFIGWPPYLLRPVAFNKKNILSLAERAGRSERQWKGFLSWTLGVAGTRHVLKNEGYRWIAPLSAFYDDAIQPVDLASWPSAFKPGVVIASKPRGSRIAIRPDYLAI